MTTAGRRDAVLLAAGVLVFAAALLAYVTVVRGQPHYMWSMNDLRVYRWGGELARHSEDLYKRQTHGFYFTYAPLAGAIFAGLSVLSIGDLRWLMTITSLLSLLGAIWVAWGALGYRRIVLRLGATLAVAGVALWMEPVEKTLYFGQINIILMFLVMADLRQPDDRSWKGAAIGLATGVKLTPAIFIVYLLFTRRFRAAAVSLITFAATVAIGFWVLPQESRQYWGGGLFMSSSRVGDVDWAGNQSLHGLLTRLFGGASAAAPYWLASAAVVGAGGLLLAARESRRGRELTGIVTCGITGLLVSPISWSHHWVWIVPVLVLAAHQVVRSPRRPWGWPRAAAWAAGGLAVAALFGAWIFAVPYSPALPQGLIKTVPFGRHRELLWHGGQLLLGNLYVVLGLTALLALALLSLPRRLVPGRRPSPPSGPVESVIATVRG